MKTLKLIDQVLKSEIDPAFAHRARFIAKQINELKPAYILDAGCGRGFYLKLVSLFAFPKKIVGIDVNESYLEKARVVNHADKRVNAINASIYELPFADNYFDLIICSEVLEHLPDDRKAVSELHRILKKGGTLIVTVPNKNFPFFWDPINWLLMRLFHTHINKNIWWLAGIWADHERLYSEQDIRSLLNLKLKIKNLKLIVRWCWPFSHFWLYGVGKNLVERLSTEELDRFNFEKISPLSSLLSSFMRLPEQLLPQIKTNSSVNLFIVSEK